MNKVAIYVRVSTTNQADEGYSIDEQIDKLKAYCEIKDWVVYKVFTDAGFTGSNIERPAMTKLISAAKKKQFDTILVYKLDRLSRSQKDTLYLIEEIFIKNGIDFLSLSENFDTSSAFGKAMIGILSVFAQLEREQIKERMMLGKVGRAKSGKTMMWAHPAYGYTYNKETSSLDIVPAEAALIKKIYELYIKGKSISKLRDYLNDNKIFVNKSVPWSHRTISYALTNPVYCGMIRYEGKLYDGLHEPIITKELFNKTQEVLAERRMEASKKNPRPFQSKYMLSGIIRCGCCNAPMKSLLGMPRKDGTRTRRYQCINRFPRKTKPVTIYNDNKKCDSGYYYMEDVEHAVLHRISTLYSDEIEASEFFEDEITFDIQKVKDEITKIESKINKLNDLYINDFISLDSLKKQSANLINEKKIIENEIEKENSKQVNNLKEDALKILATNNIHDLDYEMQSYVVKSLIDKVFVTKEDMEILFKK